MKMDVRVVNKSNHPVPKYQTDEAAGMDLRANLSSTIILAPLERSLVPTGIYMELPKGYEGQIRPRSGLAYKHGVTVLNSPGTIDSDYRGELQVLLVNLSSTSFEVKDGERVAQLVISEHRQVTLSEVDSLDDTNRGMGGFGSTGKN